jgi:hypothetical protein
MDPIERIEVNPNIKISPDGQNIRFIPNINSSTNQINNVGVRKVNVRQIADQRIWTQSTSTSLPNVPPVTIFAGTPIVDMPGCVQVHKENVKQRSRNKQLVNDDPKGNTVLCDGGMPYFTAPNYDARELTWQTIYTEAEDAPEGVDTGDVTPPAPPDTPERPPTEEPEGDPECPGPLEPRIGSVGPNEKEKVVGHELQPDPNNANKLICVSLYEDIGIVEQYLPSPQIVTTTAVIASVAASSALLAKPLADLLLRVVKPAVKQVIAKVNGVLGKTPYRPTQAELKTNEYRKKKGLLGINFAKNHQKREKAEKKRKKEEESRKKTQS